MFHLPFTRIFRKLIVYSLVNNCNAQEKLSAINSYAKFWVSNKMGILATLTKEVIFPDSSQI